MEIVAIIALFLNFVAVIGVIYLHHRQTRFERSVTAYLSGAVSSFADRAAAIQSLLTKVLVGGSIAALLAVMLKKDSEGGQDNV